MVFDSGVVIELLSGSEEAKKIEEFIEANLDEVFINEFRRN